jgi:hypothetical protein
MKFQAGILLVIFLKATEVWVVISKLDFKDKRDDQGEVN